MRIAWYSNSGEAPTGYGTQTAQVTKRLMADGHEVAVVANYGHVAGIRDVEGVPTWPTGHAERSMDVADEYTRLSLRGAPGWVVTLYDVWPLVKFEPWKDQRVISWTPIDHLAVTPEVAKWAKSHQTIAMSRHGERTLKDAGIDSVYIPHGIERVFSPTVSDIRKRMRVPDDAFLVTINAANIGVTPPRKAWGENLTAMGGFMADHPDVILYLHTDPVRPGGVNLPTLLAARSIAPDRVRIADLEGYRGGLIGADELARIYTASDVLLAVSMGEGFGLAVPEAMSCGTPAIVTDFSAQPELVGDTGWKVRWQHHWDVYQTGDFATPLIPDIRDALEQAYEERGTDAAKARSAAAIEHARQYDADDVFDRYWRPLLREMEEDLRPRQPRPGRSKAARRRQRKAAA